MPRTVVVGAPRGFAPSERIDPRRTGRTQTRLPFPAVEVWRRQISGGIELAPLVDTQGNVIIAQTIAEIIKLSPDGREIWRARTGTGAPTATPVLTSDGTLVVVTAAGQAWGLTPSGATRFTVSLGVRRDADTTPLALDDGGILIAARHSLIEIDADGVVRARATLQERAVGALLLGPEGALVTTDSGGVYTWKSPGEPRKIGSFGGQPRRGALLADSRTLLAVVDGRTLTALDLPTGTTQVRATAPLLGVLFDAPATVSPSGLGLVSTYGGLLIGVDASGSEKLTIALEKQVLLLGADAGVPVGPGAGFFGPTDLRPSAPVIVDPQGRIGFARAGGRVGVVSPEGNVGIVNERLCASPIAVQPAGDKKMLVACRDGTIWMLGE
jgi:outer membrane protein assembly factor BamB